MRAYFDLLRECLRDELWGIQFFTFISQMRKGAARERAILAVLVVLEETMRDNLVDLLRRHQQSWDQLGYEEIADAAARELAQHHQKTDWRDFIAGLEVAIPPYAARYQELLDRSPAEDRAVLELFVAHEDALLAFTRMEKEAGNVMSLGPVWSVLEKAQRLAQLSRASA